MNAWWLKSNRYIYVSTIHIKRPFIIMHVHVHLTMHYVIRELCVRTWSIYFSVLHGIKVVYKLLSSCDTFCYLSSYTAIEAPERCVFGQLINIGAVLCKLTASQKKPEIFISQAMLILSVPTLKVYKDQGKWYYKHLLGCHGLNYV